MITEIFKRKRRLAAEPGLRLRIEIHQAFCTRYTRSGLVKISTHRSKVNEKFLGLVMSMWFGGKRYITRASAEKETFAGENRRRIEERMLERLLEDIRRELLAIRDDWITIDGEGYYDDEKTKEKDQGQAVEGRAAQGGQVQETADAGDTAGHDRKKTGQ